MKDQIEAALAAIRTRHAGYARAERYYNGDHDLRFATEKFENTFGELFREFALNLCPVVCDAVSDKLIVEGFSSEEGGVEAGRAADAIWRRNRMHVSSVEVHREALRCGDAYLIVWPDDAGRAVLYPNRAASIAVFYNEDAPGVIEFAAKLWQDDAKRVRLNLFFVDRTERFISKADADQGAIDSGSLEPFGEAIENPYGVVPVFHFANNADIGLAGRSELEAAIPIQDGLNKSVLDMLVAMEFAAFRQRWATGIEVEYDEAGKAVTPFRSGAEHLWIAGDPAAKFGDFESARLDQFLAVKDSFRGDIAAVTGTPLHYFLQQAGGFPSGESLRALSQRSRRGSGHSARRGPTLSHSLSRSRAARAQPFERFGRIRRLCRTANASRTCCSKKNLASLQDGCSPRPVMAPTSRSS